MIYQLRFDKLPRFEIELEYVIRPLSTIDFVLDKQALNESNFQFLEMIDKYKEYTAIFTDGSCEASSSQAGIGVHCKESLIRTFVQNVLT